MQPDTGTRRILSDPGVLLAALLADDWRVIGPRLRDDAIVYDRIDDAADLPRGLIDAQEGGHYRLGKGNPARWFDYVVGPQTWKKWLFPSRQKLWSADRSDDGFAIAPEPLHWPKTVFFGVRACEIAAMEIQDRVFDNGDFTDTGYAMRRAGTLIVAVQCARSAATCFCASMNTGPRAEAGYDIALTELDGAETGAFLVECGTARGEAIVAALGLTTAEQRHVTAAMAATDRAATAQTRRMVPDVAALLRENLDHPNWDIVADKCLSCANCTLACPTCFCSDVEEVTDLSGDHAERWRTWDSCFTTEFSYVHGGSVRRSTKSRYRQWMTHKLSTWHDQFDTSGCVGCGRCIAWCPVGIDITAEAAAFVIPIDPDRG